MQTFLPYESFEDSAAVLDQKRLGKQRVETLQIMKTLLTGTGWVNHPAVKMWAGYERALLEYQDAVCFEWAHHRGFQDTCWVKTEELYYTHIPMYAPTELVIPPWLGNDEFHMSHQSNLIRKDPEFYSPIFVGIPEGLEYVWPV